MPYTSYSQFLSAPHLSEIISLYPEDEPFCAGYAPSQGCRCRMRTNASNRASAMAILELGTKKVHMGQMPTRDLLIDLAHCTLCTRFHQAQAEGLAERWRQDIERFLDYEYARPGLQELASLQNRAYKLLADYQRALEQEQWRQAPTPRSTPATPTTYLRTQPTISSSSAYSRSESIASTASTRNNLPGGAYATAAPQPAYTSTSSSTSRNAAQTRSRISATETTAREEDSRALHSDSAVEDATNRPGSSTGTSSGGSGDMATREAVGTMRATAHRTARTTTTSTVSTRPIADNPRSTSNDTSESVVLSRLQPLAIGTAPSSASTSATRRTATRRTIEGDCGICLEPLRESGGGRSSSSCSRSENNGYAATADGEASGPVRSTAVQSSYGGNDRNYAELTWCKTQCGANYHAICMRTWLTTTPNPTCPTCRGVWVNDHLET
ncbi:uncharacterized protein BDW70DRAFT_142959 [Aspergillus foveolatus]|uniref:uncharacterized protein n=1 Tax=Aspergillus foveolatus TaxID=210207 RepID=UPI003CCDA33B